MNIIYKTQRGLLFKPAVLNRVAPLFFGPRLTRTIRLKGVGLEAREIHIALGNENLMGLSPQMREQLERRVQALCRHQGIETLGVTRGVKPESLNLLAQEGRRGDRFIIALALLKIEEVLGKAGGQRVILVSDQKLAFYLAVRVSDRFKLPVLLQCRNPRQHEAAVLRMLHQEGLALSLAVLKPARWRKDDIISCWMRATPV